MWLSSSKWCGEITCFKSFLGTPGKIHRVKVVCYLNSEVGRETTHNTINYTLRLARTRRDEVNSTVGFDRTAGKWMSGEGHKWRENGSEKGVHCKKHYQFSHYYWYYTLKYHAVGGIHMLEQVHCSDNLKCNHFYGGFKRLSCFFGQQEAQR